MMGDFEVLMGGGCGGWWLWWWVVVAVVCEGVWRWWRWWASVCECIPAAAIAATKLVLKSDCTSTKLPTLEDEETREKKNRNENRKMRSKKHHDLSD